jgi:hypothetical protein
MHVAARQLRRGRGIGREGGTRPLAGKPFLALLDAQGDVFVGLGRSIEQDFQELA